MTQRRIDTPRLRALAHAQLRALVTALLCALLATALTACGGGGDNGGGTAGAGGTKGASASSDAGTASGASFSQPATTALSETGGAGIDTSHASDGYVSASATSDSRLKFQISCGDMTYNYDLPNDGTPMVYPMNMGDGSYLLRVMQNTEGNNYVELDSTTVDVALSDEFGPFLIPTMYCNYNADSNCVTKAREITSSASNMGEAVQAVCTYVAENVTYDEAKAEELSKKSGYVPDPDSTLASKTGICFDYASLSAAMLRSLGIPTKLVTGYVGSEQLYHAWIMVNIDGTWQSVGFSVSPNTWSRCDVTFASTGATKYSGDGSNYTDRYVY